MNKKIDLKQNKFLCINIIISLIFFFFIFYLNQNMCLFNDDLYVGVDNLNDLSAFKNPLKMHGGGFLCFILFKLFNYSLPTVLNYHISDFISFQVAIFKSVATVLICFLISKFSILFFQSKRILSLFFSITSIYIICLVSNPKEEYFVSGLISNFVYFRYLFILLFFSVFWYFIYKNILFSSNVKTYKLILISLCGFIISSSIEILLFSSFILIFLIIFYNFIINILKKLNVNIKFSDLNFYLNQNFWIPIISFILGALWYITSVGFIDVAKMRGLNNIYIDFDTIKEFSLLYFKLYIADFWLYWIIFIFSIILIIGYCIKSNQNKKILFLALFMQISIMLAVYSLILCGKTEYTGNYWLVSGRIIALYKMIILYSLYIFLSVILFEFKKNTPFLNIFERKILVYVIHSILVVCLIFSITFYHTGYKSLLNKNSCIKFYKSVKKNNYIAEKMLRFYYLKDEVPVLPIQLIHDETEENSSYLPFFMFGGYSENCSNSSFMANIYYPLIYKDNKSIKQGYCFSRNAYEKFYAKGGIITDEELENINFSRLLNNNFVLNK